MKKLISILIVATMLSSCSDKIDSIEKTGTKQTLIFTATMEKDDNARATYDTENQCASWEIGDFVSINGKKYKALQNGTTSQFEMAEEQKAEGPEFNAYFPYELYNGTTATLPACITQKWTEGQFNMPMYAQSNTTDLSFKNLCGVLKITIPSTQVEKVRSITVSSANLSTSGEFSIVNHAASLLNPSTKASVTVIYTQEVTIGDNGQVFYVAIPPQKYHKLSIEVFDGQRSKVMTTTTGVEINVERNKIYPISFADNTGITQPFIVMGGKKWSTMNLGAEKVYGTYEECCGDYYQWGSINKLYTSKEWKNYESYSEWDFVWRNLPDLQYEGFSKDYLEYHPTPDIISLPLDKDAARCVWGVPWRMPTNDDFNNLATACRGYGVSTTFRLTEASDSTISQGDVYWLPSNHSYFSGLSEVGGVLFVDRVNTYKRLFLPAARSIDRINTDVSDKGYYWSSNIQSLDSGIQNAYFLYFNKHDSANTLYLEINYRYLGYSIRPVAD